jgi:hypothetical protein
MLFSKIPVFFCVRKKSHCKMYRCTENTILITILLLIKINILLQDVQLTDFEVDLTELERHVGLRFHSQLDRSRTGKLCPVQGCRYSTYSTCWAPVPQPAGQEQDRQALSGSRLQVQYIQYMLGFSSTASWTGAGLASSVWFRAAGTVHTVHVGLRFHSQLDRSRTGKPCLVQGCRYQYLMK